MNYFKMSKRSRGGSSRFLFRQVICRPPFLFAASTSFSRNGSQSCGSRRWREMRNETLRQKKSMQKWEGRSLGRTSFFTSRTPFSIPSLVPSTPPSVVIIRRKQTDFHLSFRSFRAGFCAYTYRNPISSGRPLPPFLLLSRFARTPPRSTKGRKGPFLPLPPPTTQTPALFTKRNYQREVAVEKGSRQRWRRQRWGNTTNFCPSSSLLFSLHFALPSSKGGRRKRLKVREEG